ncbi:hypothetical protein MKW98_027188 [Papaver atlanticum]|uniref:Uncharacterized protein n=1 Tax=Papaver atlanticum TaxID=357466 RepID=A0AAD4T3X0_9MAGN|nr:hypothetical protein MKW98_027188 [Papaver atlanticum]
MNGIGFQKQFRFVLDWENEQMISIFIYRGILRQEGSPLCGKRTHTNARISRKQNRK